MKSIKLLVAFVLLAPVITGCFPMIDPALLPTRAGLTGTWLAFSRSDGYRLDLLPDGSAELAVNYDFEKETVRRYTAARWELDGYDFSAKFLPADKSDSPIYVRAWATDDSLQDVSIGSSSSAPGPRTPEFLRESRARDLMKTLTGEH